jgi:hypothetical protein
MLEMFATTVQAELNATESGLQDILTSRWRQDFSPSFPNVPRPFDALKGKAYANKPRTIQELENNIRREIAAISEGVL